MKMEFKDRIEAAEIVLPCTELNETLAFFTDRLGFRVETILPADAPTTAVVSGYGLRLRLLLGASGSASVLRLLCRDPATLASGATELVAPNGSRIELVDANPPLVVPPEQQSFVLTRLGEGTDWKAGRAGMQYRDLISNRQGGRFIASHIRIPNGGPVPDYVHFHKIRFQMIFCYKGWVRVVYEDQGPPFLLRAGDCVLQPPEIRHRVLASSPGLEVIEIGSPAVHGTFADHGLELPTERVNPLRNFGGQRFVRHQAETATWLPWRLKGTARDFGIAEATNGLAGVRVARPCQGQAPKLLSHSAEFVFLFVLSGEMRLLREGEGPLRMVSGDSCVVPAGLAHALADCSSDLELLDVSLPARFETTFQ